MFYKLLFILAIYHLFKSVKDLLNREPECEKGEKAKMPAGKCVSVPARSDAGSTLLSPMTMITSTVVDVRNLTEKGVEIETKNTVYKLTYFGDGSLPYAV